MFILAQITSCHLRTEHCLLLADLYPTLDGIFSKEPQSLHVKLCVHLFSDKYVQAERHGNPIPSVPLPLYERSNIVVKSWVLVAHTYNPGYSGGRDRRTAIQSQPWANSS
jgi:hypothetical protein